MLVYLAGPIDGVSSEEALGWRREISGSVPRGVVCFSPCSAYLETATGKAADRANRAVIRETDLLIANLLGGGLKIGTMREIEYARSLSIPVLVISADARASLAAHDLTVVDTLGDAKAHLSLAQERMRVPLRDHRSIVRGRSHILDDGKDTAARE